MNSDSKEYPTNYPADAIAILDSMSVTKGKGVELVGSMSLRSQQYAGDYDANDMIKMNMKTDKDALDHCASLFKEAIRRTSKIANAYIGDIKCGEVAEWRVFGSDKDTRVHNGQVVGYNAETSRSKVRGLHKAQIITPTEEKEALALLPSNPTPLQLVKAKDSIKFHIVRWSVAEVLEGEKRLKDGRTYTLQDGFSSHGITKVDVVAWVQNNRYTEFAMIYFLFNHGKALNPMKFDYEDSLKESILYYQSEGMYFKVLKRLFSLAKFKDDKTQMEKLTEVLNSDLGRLYHIVSDIRTLEFLLEEQSKLRMSDIKFEIDQFKGRMANIYALDPFLKKEFVFLGYINSALKSTSSKQLLGVLKSMEKALSDILGKASQKFVGGKISRETLDKNFAFPSPTYPQGVSKFVGEILGNAYHYLQNRSAVERSASLGLRQLANDILEADYEKNKEKMDGTEREKVARLKASHQKAIDTQEAKLLEQIPTIAQFYNSDLKSIVTKIAKLYDDNYDLVKKFLEENPDIKVNKKGVESRAVEWALRNKEALKKTKIGDHFYWEKQPTLDKLESGEETATKTVRAKTEARATEKLGSFVSILKPKARASVAENKRIEEEKKKAEEAEKKRKAEQSARDRARVLEMEKAKRAEQSAKDRLKAEEQKRIKEDERLAKEKADAEARAATKKAKTTARVKKAKAEANASDEAMKMIEDFDRQVKAESEAFKNKVTKVYRRLAEQELQRALKRTQEKRGLTLSKAVEAIDNSIIKIDAIAEGVASEIASATVRDMKLNDKETDELMKTFPSEELVAILKEEWEKIKSEIPSDTGVLGSISNFIGSMMGTK